MFSQFVTLDDAKSIATQLGDMGGGVLPYNANTELESTPPLQNTDPQRSGIYIPVYAQFATPQNGDQKFYHFRFKNGAEGFNAGLIKMTMAIYPTRWPLMLGTELNQAARTEY